MRRLLVALVCLACLGAQGVTPLPSRVVGAAADARYWVGETGTTDQTSGWSESSGGPGGATLPDGTQNAIWDANSCSGACNVQINNNPTWLNLWVQSGASNVEIQPWGNFSVTLNESVILEDGSFIAPVANVTMTIGEDWDSAAINLGVINNVNPTFTGDVSNIRYAIDTSQSFQFGNWTYSSATGTQTFRPVGGTVAGRDINLASLTMSGGTVTASRAEATDSDWAVTIEFQPNGSAKPLDGTGTIGVERIEYAGGELGGFDFEIETDITYALQDLGGGSAQTVTIRGQGSQDCASGSSPEVTFDGTFDPGGSTFNIQYGSNVLFNANGFTNGFLAIGGGGNGCSRATFTTGTIGPNVSTVQVGGNNSARPGQLDLGSASHTAGCLLGAGRTGGADPTQMTGTGQITLTDAPPNTCTDIKYIDPTGGADGNSGDSCGAAWETWANVNGHLLTSGDCVYLCDGETLALGASDDLQASLGAIRTEPGASTRATITIPAADAFEMYATATPGIYLCDVIVDTL